MIRIWTEATNTGWAVKCSFNGRVKAFYSRNYLKVQIKKAQWVGNILIVE